MEQYDRKDEWHVDWESLRSFCVATSPQNNDGHRVKISRSAPESGSDEDQSKIEEADDDKEMAASNMNGDNETLAILSGENETQAESPGSSVTGENETSTESTKPPENNWFTSELSDAWKTTTSNGIVLGLGQEQPETPEPTIISNVTLKNSTEEKLDDGYADEKERNGELPSSPPLEKIIYDSITEREWTSTIAEGAQIRFAKNMNGYRLDIIFNKTCDFDLRHKLFNRSDIWILERAQIGPDEVLVHLEGASIQVEVAKSIDFCARYFADFQIPESGVYRLKVLRLRTNYTAVSDHGSYPEVNYQEFLDVKLSDNLDVFAPLPCEDKEEVSGYWVSHEPSGPNGYYVENSISIKNECKHPGMFRGLPMYTNVAVHKSFKDERCARDINNYYWNRKICNPEDYNQETDHWGDVVEYNNPNITEALSPHPFGFSYPEENSWFASKRILFVGDTHVKGLADHFLSHVCKFWYLHDFDSNQTRHTVDIETDSMDPFHAHGRYVEIKFVKEEYSNYRKPIDECRKRDKNDINACPAYQQATDPEAKRIIYECFQDERSRSCDLFNRDCSGSTFAYLEAKFCQKDLTAYMKDFNYVVFNCDYILIISVIFQL